MKKSTVYFSSDGQSGNIFFILASVREALHKQRRFSDYNELRDRVFECRNYEEALNAIKEYVILIDLDGNY